MNNKIKFCGSATCPNNKTGIGTDSLCNCKKWTKDEEIEEQGIMIIALQLANKVLRLERKDLKQKIEELENQCNCPRATINGFNGDFCEFFDDNGELCKYGKQ